MQLEGAVVKEQGLTFAIVVVKHHVIGNSGDANRAMSSFSSLFPGMPIVLMAQDSRGIPTYYGRKDIARFLANIPVSAIPWKKYTFN